MMRKSFSIHCDFFMELRRLGSGKRGDLLLALINWATDQDPPPLDSEAAMLFRLMCAQIERISEANSKSGSQGGRPSEKSEKSEESGKSGANRKKPTVSVTAPVSDTVTVTEDHPPTPACGEKGSVRFARLSVASAYPRMRGEGFGCWFIRICRS
jgi:hypothetical protein